MVTDHYRIERKFLPGISPTFDGKWVYVTAYPTLSEAECIAGDMRRVNSHLAEYRVVNNWFTEFS